MMRQSVYGNLLALVVVLMACMMVWVVYLLFFDFREPPIRIVYSHPTTVAHDASERDGITELPAVKAGGVFYTYREYCITSGYAVLRNERWLIPEDPQVKPVPFPLLPAQPTREVRCEQRTFTSRLPDGVKPGKYRYRVMWIYMLDGNPIATFRWNWPDVVVWVKK